MKRKLKMKYTVAVELLALSVLFSIMTLTIDVRPIGPLNTYVGLSHINDAVRSAIGVNYTTYVISEILGYTAIAVAVAFGVIGLVQLIKRKSLAKVDISVILLGVLYILTIALYVAFDKLALNYRPVIMPGEVVPEASFPSSHTMLAIVVFGSAAIVVSEYIHRENIAKVIRCVLVILAIATIVCRFISGVHWVTDIIASILIGATLLEFFSAARMSAKRREVCVKEDGI